MVYLERLNDAVFISGEEVSYAVITLMGEVHVPASIVF